MYNPGLVNARAAAMQLYFSLLFEQTMEWLSRVLVAFKTHLPPFLAVLLKTSPLPYPLH